jgi:hypothetical protein
MIQMPAAWQLLYFSTYTGSENTILGLRLFSTFVGEKGSRIPGTGIEHPASCIMYPASCIMDPVS